MPSQFNAVSPTHRRLMVVATGASVMALAPFTIAAQASNDTTAAADTTSVQRASVAQAQTTSQPITLCIVPGSGTAYRVGGPGLPTQCIAATHTPLSLNLTGPQGIQGLTGAKGDTGATGPKGETGAKGDSGAVGAKGDTGEAGLQGAAGQQGEVGPAGRQGEPGVPGEVGPSGEIGPLGPVGPAGAAGTPGPAGEPGEPGAAGTPGAAGAPGVQGIQGLQGDAGAPGTTDHSALTNLTVDSHPQYLVAGPREAIDGFSVSGSTGSGALAPSGGSTRLVWNPRKASFRAGAVGGSGSERWNDDNMGYHSTAFGFNTLSNGSASFATGTNTQASGSNTFSAGEGSEAQGYAAAAFNGSAWGEYSLAVGRYSESNSANSIALGENAKASGIYATAIGASSSNGERSVSIGYGSDVSGDQSIVIGSRANSTHAGSVVISAVAWDGNHFSSTARSTAANQFVVRATGGIALWTDFEQTQGATLLPGGGAWEMVSDRNKKTAFRDVDGESLLTKLRSVPVSSWSYKAQDQAIRHIGPMAQDWQQAFALSNDVTTINSGDIAGVTLAGVQALDARTSKAAQRMVSHEQRINELELQVQQLLQELRAMRETNR